MALNDAGFRAPMAKIRGKLPGVDWFGDLPEEVRLDLQRFMKQRWVSAGQTIYLEGDAADCLYRIASGRVRIRKLSPCGNEFMMVIYGPGNVIGSVSLVDGLPRPTDAVAESDTCLDTLSATDFDGAARRHPELYKAIAIGYAMWIRDHQTMVVRGYTLEERLARRLDFLLEFGAEEDTGTGALRIDFTQEMLASSVAVSRQAISKLLQDWQDEGVIQYRYGSVLVLDRPRLRLLAGRQMNWR